MEHTTEMIRPFWTDPQTPELDHVTVLICQNKTPDITRLCLESLLTFYPTIKILVVNSDEKDESTKYLKYKEACTPNLKIWVRVGDNSHGGGMHDAIVSHISTTYFLTLDNDTIIKRGGFIEKMLDEFTDDTLTVGTLNFTDRSNDSVGWPKKDSDAIRYAHPSCSLWHRPLYMELSADGTIVADHKGNTCRPQFSNHGSPCWSIMLAAEKSGYKVEGFPIENYVMHLSGASYTIPRTVWSWDNGVFIRPLITFISDDYIDQNDKDYDIIPFGRSVKGEFVIHKRDPQKVDNDLFYNRLRITGDFVCVPDKEITPDAVSKLREAATIQDNDYHIIDGVYFFKREYYQNFEAWK